MGGLVGWWDGWWGEGVCVDCMVGGDGGGGDLEYQELALLFGERGLQQSYNFYPGSTLGKVSQYSK